MNILQKLIKDFKTIDYDKDKFHEWAYAENKKNVVLRSPKDIAKIRKAVCFEGHMYMAYKAREHNLEPRVFHMVYRNNQKTYFHSYIFIRDIDQKWVLIDWPNNVEVILRSESLEDIINQTIAIDYSESDWEYIEVDEVNVEKIQDTITYGTFVSNPYRSYCTSRKNPKIKIDDLDKILDSIQKVEYDFDTLKALTSAKTIEDRRKVKLNTVQDIMRYNKGICYDSRIYLAYLASQYNLDWRYYYYERYDPKKQRYKAHGVTIIEQGGRWHLFINDDYAAKGKTWAPVYPLKDIRDPEWWKWDISRIGVLDNFEGYILYFNDVPKTAIEGLFGAKSLTYGQYIDIVGSNRHLVKDKHISKIEVKLYNVSTIYYKDGTKIEVKSPK